MGRNLQPVTSVTIAATPADPRLSRVSKPPTGYRRNGQAQDDKTNCSRHRPKVEVARFHEQEDRSSDAADRTRDREVCSMGFAQLRVQVAGHRTRPDHGLRRGGSPTPQPRACAHDSRGLPSPPLSLPVRPSAGLWWRPGRGQRAAPGPRRGRARGGPRAPWRPNSGTTRPAPPFQGSPGPFRLLLLLPGGPCTGPAPCVRCAHVLHVHKQGGSPP